MQKHLYIGECKVCKHGMLEIVVLGTSHEFSVMCDECHAEWHTPEEAITNNNGFRDMNPSRKVREATLAEIIENRWDTFLTPRSLDHYLNSQSF